MDKFIKEHGHILLWFVFIFFIFTSLIMLFTQGVRYALAVFIPSVILLCPPIIKFIQKKTRIKKIVLAGVSALVMLLTMIGTNHFSSAKKEENIRINQEKRQEELSKKAEQKSDEEQMKEEEQSKIQQTNVVKKKEATKVSDQEKTTQSQKQLEEKQKSDLAKQQATQQKRVVVRASKKSGQYYVSGHPAYNNIAANNLLVFNSEDAAQKAGYKRAT